MLPGEHCVAMLEHLLLRRERLQGREHLRIDALTGEIEADTGGLEDEVIAASRIGLEQIANCRVTPGIPKGGELGPCSGDGRISGKQVRHGNTLPLPFSMGAPPRRTLIR